MTGQFDYVIVGSGPAGCVLAARLSEDPGTEVLLLEAGEDRRSLFRTMPLGLPFVYQDSSVQWGHRSGPEPGLHGRTIDEKGGRLLGGSSSINAMIFNRGNPLDYEGWARTPGLEDWSWSRVLPYFRKLETFEDGAGDHRGGDGPMRINRAEARHPLFESFLDAGLQGGFDVTPDHNGYRQEGMHIAQVNIHRGQRWGTREAYLRPALVRPNLTVLTGAAVRGLRLDGTTVRGVDVVARGEERVLTATREVILSAGAMNSPKLLMLSGVGPPEELARHGIPLRAEAPRVGRNVQNHPGVDVQFSTPARHSLTAQVAMHRRPLFGAQWLLTRKGLGASNLFEAGAFLRTRDDVDFPNMQYEFLPLCRRIVGGRVVAIPGFQVWMDLSRPQSRGTVTLTSADPEAPVRTVFNTYGERQDLQDVVDGVRLLRERVASQPALQRYRPEELNPGPDLGGDDRMEAWVRKSTGTSYHASSSCSMGRDNEDSVVDGEGRVHAVHGLRVVDASIIPHSVTANLQACVIMMAEKIADRIRGRAPLAPSPAAFHRTDRPTR